LPASQPATNPTSRKMIKLVRSTRTSLAADAR
jgi:hypothetical protein